MTTFSQPSIDSMAKMISLESNLQEPLFESSSIYLEDVGDFDDFNVSPITVPSQTQPLKVT